MELKYLFTVIYSDDTVFHQTKDDVSKTRPGGSAYTDVRQDDVRIFFLWNGKKDTYAVDLENGFFCINGKEFCLHDPKMPLSKKRLIFYREHHVSVNVQTKKETGHEIGYVFGWQAQDENGNNIKHIIQIF